MRTFKCIAMHIGEKYNWQWSIIHYYQLIQITTGKLFIYTKIYTIIYMSIL